MSSDKESAKSHSQRNPVRVLVRTLPLGNNYGNILQCYALQRALQQLGAQVATDVTQSKDGRSSVPPSWSTDLKHALIRFGISRPGWAASVADRDLHRFVSRRIDTCQLYKSPGCIDGAVLSRYNVFLSGSDQVWRAPYGDVRSYLFDFLSSHDRRPRYSYAASFGRADISEYDPTLLKESSELAQRFSAISVREASGISIVNSTWHMAAVQHIDPTMLVEQAHYRELAAEASDAVAADQVVSYVLDRSDFSRRAVSRVAELRGRSIVALTTDYPTARELRTNESRVRRPSIESWLGAIGNADFVVTDSFHGTVFSIIYNVPFITIVNSDRGASRFADLLTTFGLEGRAIDSGLTEIDALLGHEIDWTTVNQRIEFERVRGSEYLSQILQSPREHNPHNVILPAADVPAVANNPTRTSSAGALTPVTRPLVSVIIPVYKESKDVFARCLTSVLDQDYAALEVIVVDDGSPMPVSEWVKSLAADRARVVRQQNAGLSAALNAGLDRATGEFVCFVDADDYVPSGFVKDALEVIRTENADVAFGGIELLHTDGVSHWRGQSDLASTGSLLTGEAVNVVRANALSASPRNDEDTPVTCVTNARGALFSRHFIAEHRFRVGTSYAEDRLFLVDVLGGAKRVALTTRPWYFYDCTSSTSITRGLTPAAVEGLSQVVYSFVEVGGFLSGSEDSELRSASATGVLNYLKVIAGLLGACAPLGRARGQFGSILASPGVRSAVGSVATTSLPDALFALCARRGLVTSTLLLAWLWAKLTKQAFSPEP